MFENVINIPFAFFFRMLKFQLELSKVNWKKRIFFGWEVTNIFQIKDH